MPCLNHLPFLSLTITLGLILSNLFMPIWGVFPFPLFLTADFPWKMVQGAYPSLHACSPLALYMAFSVVKST